MQLPSSSSSSSPQFQFQSQSDEKKNLYICLNTDTPQYFDIRSIPANSLFNKKQQRKREPPPPPPLNEVFSAISLDGFMGCAVLGSTLYVVGGGVESKSVFGYNTANRSSFTVPDMISRKNAPFVLPVGERLYVLYSYTDRNMQPPVFEVYDPLTNKWEQLDPPPFLNPMDKKHFDSFGDLYGCAVIGTSICVSTTETSFKYDTQNKIWEPCMLFEAMAADLNWISHVTTPTPCCGPPFGFLDQAVLFDDDILICMHEPVKGVVAYKINGGKVVGSQYCLPIPRLTQSSYIAEFGNGAFCLVLTQCLMAAEDCRLHSPILVVKPFLIKKKTGLKLEGGQVKDFLHCEVVNEFIYTPKFHDLEDEIWNPIYCFVQ